MRGRTGRRRFLAAFLLVALLVAGVGSYYASSHPDGLQRVAERAGFADRARKSPSAEGPLAGYRTRGVEDERLSRGVAGVGGALLVLGLGTGVFWALRRRTDDTSPEA